MHALRRRDTILSGEDEDEDEDGGAKSNVLGRSLLFL